MEKIDKQIDLITLDGVSKNFSDGGIGLSSVSLSVAQGQFLCLVGPSGSGKSTILKLIAGLEKPDSGTVDAPKSVSMVFQDGALFPWLSVAENVELVLEAAGEAAGSIHRESSRYLTMMGLGDFEDKYPRELSGGQRQRVGIARALAVKPKVLLLDEPFSALDIKTTDELHADLLKIWQAAKGELTVVMVSHSVEEAVVLADRVVVVKDHVIADTFNIVLPRPHREQGHPFGLEIERIRKAFF